MIISNIVVAEDVGDSATPRPSTCSDPKYICRPTILSVQTAVAKLQRKMFECSPFNTEYAIWAWNRPDGCHVFVNNTIKASKAIWPVDRYSPTEESIQYLGCYRTVPFEWGTDAMTVKAPE